MRRIGELDNELHARTFGDYLYVQGIDNDVEESGGAWQVWVHDDDHLERARHLLARFREEPDAAEYTEAAPEADQLRKEEEKEEREAAARTFDSRRLWPRRSAAGMGTLTLALVGISVVVSLLSGLGQNGPVLRPLLISEYAATPWWAGLPEIKRGEVWRLITPIFIHFGVLHLLFNMLWLRDLGGMLERTRGTGYLALLVGALAVVSNLGQYAFGGPMFGGMSGVVYGLLGYIWMKSKYDPGSGLVMHPTTVTFMIVWFFLCLSGAIGNVANAAHGFGLVMGVGWGYLSAMARTR